jgi:hypothetical protein
MPITLSTLFTSPQDVWDTLSVEGVDLRLDDPNRATGNPPLPVSLLKGAVLTFDLAGMSVPVKVALSAAANVGSTSVSVAALESAVLSGAKARDSGVNAATGARLLVACRKGTSKVKLYCNQRYDDSQLVLAGTVCDWATKIACHWLCQRRAQGCPKSVLADYKEALEELAMVQSGALSVEDIGTRGVDWPSVTNFTVNPGYNGMRARVVPYISEGTPTAFPQFVDWNSAASLEF